MKDLGEKMDKVPNIIWLHLLCIPGAWASFTMELWQPLGFYIGIIIVCIIVAYDIFSIVQLVRKRREKK